MEQTREPMNKKRISGLRCWAKRQATTKPISIKNTGGKSDGCAWKAVELTSGDLPFVSESRLRMERFILTGRQKSAEGRSSVASLGNREGAKARTVPARG